jgi:hypothetical protein
MHAFSAFEQQQQRDRAVQEIDRLEEIDRVVHAPPVVNQLVASHSRARPLLARTRDDCSSRQACDGYMLGIRIQNHVLVF